MGKLVVCRLFWFIPGTSQLPHPQGATVNNAHSDAARQLWQAYLDVILACFVGTAFAAFLFVVQCVGKFSRKPVNAEEIASCGGLNSKTKKSLFLLTKLLALVNELC